MKTGRGLAEFALSTLGAPYMYGNDGKVITEKLIQQKKVQYPKDYSDSKIAHLRKSIGKIGYECNSYLTLYLGKERSANGWRDYGYGGNIETMPDVVGVSVFYEGHTGVYIGNGEVLEARGTFYGVVITKLKDRQWKWWRKFSEIDYGGESVILQKGSKDLKRGGSCGELVEIWQGYLMDLNIKMMANNIEYLKDGSFGTATENGTKKFQNLYGLNETGVVDYLTLSKMLNLLPKKQDNTKELKELNEIKVAIKILKEVIKNVE